MIPEIIAHCRKLVPIALIVSGVGNLDERSKPRENASLLACLSRVYFLRYPLNEEVVRRLPKVVSEVLSNKVNETWRSEGSSDKKPTFVMSSFSCYIEIIRSSILRCNTHARTPSEWRIPDTGFYRRKEN